MTCYLTRASWLQCIVRSQNEHVFVLLAYHFRFHAVYELVSHLEPILNAADSFTKPNGVSNKLSPKSSASMKCPVFRDDLADVSNQFRHTRACIQFESVREAKRKANQLNSQGPPLSDESLMTSPAISCRYWPTEQQKQTLLPNYFRPDRPVQIATGHRSSK